MRRASLALAAAVAVVVLFAGRHLVARAVGKARRIVEARSEAADRPVRAFVGRTGMLAVGAQPLGPHPRVLLTPERVAAVTSLRAHGSASYTMLIAACDHFRQTNEASGYEAWDWGSAALDLALCGKVTGDAAYSAAGVRYFQALLDDKGAIGDGAGGDAVVHHDDGYSIRTHGWLGAMAYDWLHDAPGMTPALRKHAVDRFVAWTSWFDKSGFSHDEPISNYYMGYFGAVAFAGIAADGDDPRASQLRQQTQRMWNQEIVPSYATKLAGGDFPEGWQYGDMVGAILAIYAGTESAAHPSKPVFDDLPWLRETVMARTYALLPDGKHTYDAADWSHKPAVAPAHMMFALSLVLPPDDPAGSHAAFLAKLARDDVHEDWRWLAALAEAAGHPPEDPRKGPESLYVKGFETVYARSDWTPGALWLSLTSEPKLSDHEHLDDGHFELARGSDMLLVDGGGYGSPSSVSHNVVLVDDPLQSTNWDVAQKQHNLIVYKRNQGPWNDTAHVARYEEGGTFAYALADYASAFNPPDWKPGHDRAVTRAEREILFSRSPVAAAGSSETGRVIVYDRITLSDARFTTAFALHSGAAPALPSPGKPVAIFSAGQSSAWVTTLSPAGATPATIDVTHNKYSDDRPWFSDVPPEETTMFRYEVATPAQAPAATERRFLNAIVVGARAGGSASPGNPQRIDGGDHVEGAFVDGEAYVFSSAEPATTAAPLSYRAPRSATRHFIADLAPSAAYAITAAPDGDACKVTLSPGHGKAASSSGVLVVDLAGCALR